MKHRYMIFWIPQTKRWAVEDLLTKRIIRRYVERNLVLAMRKCKQMNEKTTDKS